MIKWFKKLFYIVKNYDELAAAVKANTNNINWLEQEMNDAVALIRSRTEMHVDAAPMSRGSPHQIILIGHYRGQDYIQTYSVQADDFKSLVDQCRQMSKYAHMERVDAVPMMKEILDNETKWWWT